MNQSNNTSAFIEALSRPPRNASNGGVDPQWAIILTFAAIIGSIALVCLTPFAALAAAFAGTLRLRSSLVAMTCAWLANQAVGFGLYNYPTDPTTILWGVAIGAAALLATVVSTVVMQQLAAWKKPAAVLVTFAAAFITYEITLFVAALFLGGLSTFTPAIISQIALSNVVWLGGIIVLNEIVVALSPLWHGMTTRLVRA